MIELTDLAPYGKVEFIGSGAPTSSIVGARLNSTYCNSNNGSLWICIDPTFNQQEWVSDAGDKVSGIWSPTHPDLIAMYTMDNINGATVVNGNGNTTFDAVFYNTPISTSGLIGNALDFNGTTQGLVIDNVELKSTVTDIAVSFWINTPSLPTVPFGAVNQTGTIALASAGNRFNSGDLGGGLFYFDFGSVVTASDGRVSFTWPAEYNNRWLHMVCQYESGVGLSIYIDGVLKVSGGATSQQVNFNVPGNPHIALMFNGLRSASAFTDGLLDQFRIFNRALTTQEITDLYIEKPITAFDHPDLVAAYTMDNIIGGTTLVDESSNNNDGTINGATQVSGILGNALFFDAVNDYVACPSLATTQGAISFFLKPSADSRQRLFVQSNTTSDNDFLAVRLENSKVQLLTSVSTIEADDVLSSGVWYFVVIQSSGTTTDFYIDGVLSTKNVVALGDPGIWFGDIAGQPFDIGRFNRLSGASYDGTPTIDQLRIFNRTLTQSEIAQLYKGGIGA